MTRGDGRTAALGPVLAVETAVLTGGVALVGEEGVIAEHLLDVRVTYSERLLPSIEALLAEAGLAVRDLGGIAVSVGPGSFTGLRIGIASAQGLALAASLPLAAVGTLEALAWNLWGAPGLVAPLLDARRGEVYGAGYRLGGASPECRLAPAARVPEEMATSLEAARGAENAALAVGPGARLVLPHLERLAPGRWSAAPAHLMHPRPAAVGELGRRRLLAGESVLPAELDALYLRPAQARTLASRAEETR